MTPRLTLEQLYAAAIAAADPYRATRVALDASRLGTRPWIIAAGKAAHAMARAAVDALADAHRTPAGGILIAPNDNDAASLPLQTFVGDHPVPSDRSFAAARALEHLTSLVRPGDDVVVLLSGGASSLLAAPVDGVAEHALISLFDGMIRSGAPIGTMNAFRRRVLRWGGGRLAQALSGANVMVLIASDVLGSALESIGSGPCAPDPLRASDLIEMSARLRLTTYLPPEVRDYLDATLTGVRPETPKSNDVAFARVTTQIVLDNRVAIDGVTAEARREGLFPIHVAPNPIEGSARATGEAIARAAVAVRAGASEVAVSAAGMLMVWGGETTVKLSPSDRGLGGRSQELALAAAEVLHLAGESGQHIAVLSAGTDGRDGPTDAAGAVVDASTWERARANGRDPLSDLERHDSYRALDAAGALFRPGMTGTNVNDIVVVLVS